MIRPRVGLAVLYVPFYESIAPMREEKLAFARAVAKRLNHAFDVFDCGLVASEEEAAGAGERLSREPIDAVIVVPAVATFGALGWAVLERVRVPVCIWNVQPDAGIPPGYDISGLIRNSGGLGAQALANTLAREGRDFMLAFSMEQDPLPSRMIRFAESAAVWHALRTARFGRIGAVFPQMTDIAMDPRLWPGSAVVEIPLEQIQLWYERQSGGDVASRVQEIRGAHAVADITEDELSRSARLSLALDRIVQTNHLDGGAFNCHGENCLQNNAIGVTACYGVSRQSSEGRPFSCTGDLPTAIAMKILQELAGAAIYGELDLVDSERDIVLLANGGEGHFGASAGPVRIAGNENFRGVHGRGASLSFESFSGAATILSFTPLAGNSRYRMIAAEGIVAPPPSTRLTVFHAAFRFRGIAATDAYERWCEAGAVHHLALAPGEWAGHLKQIARMSGFELVTIGGTRC